MSTERNDDALLASFPRELRCPSRLTGETIMFHKTRVIALAAFLTTTGTVAVAAQVAEIPS